MKAIKKAVIIFADGSNDVWENTYISDSILFQQIYSSYPMDIISQINLIY